MNFKLKSWVILNYSRKQKQFCKNKILSEKNMYISYEIKDNIFSVVIIHIFYTACNW